jgi:signal transduction histidine kinase
MPYGEPGDDWLHLDRERINNPTERISNNQVIGFIEVFQEKTPELRDKTNREGLIENDAFWDLRSLVRSAITFFHSLWLQDRPRVHRPQPRVSVTQVGHLHQAHTVAGSIHRTARPDIPVEVPVRPGESDGNQTSKGSQESTPAEIETVSQQEASRRLLSQINQAIMTGRVDQTARDEQRDILLHLAVTGIAAERVVHEFGRQVAPALQAMQRIRPGNQSDTEALDILEACLGALRNEFRSLAPYEGVNRFQRSAPVSVKRAIETAIVLNQKALAEYRILASVEGNSFDVIVRPASLVQVFDNLIDNACFWLQEAPSERVIRLLMDAGTQTVLVADSGPGIPPQVTDSLFQPYVTLRAGRRGLGLYIVRELLAGCDSDIKLCGDDVGTGLSGASFLIDLSRCARPEQGYLVEDGQYEGPGQ